MQDIDDRNGELARRYLLGQLPADEAARLEAEMLADAELFDTIAAVRSELLDAYVRGTLSEADRKILAPRFERERERLRFAEALAQLDPAPARSRSAYWLWAAAAMLILLAGIAFWPRTTPPQNTPSIAVTETTATTLAPKPEPPPPAPVEAVAAITIALATTRDDEPTSPKLALPSNITSVALTIRLHPADRFASYDVDVKTASGAPVWKGNAELAAPGEIVARIPASALKTGEHQIFVTGHDRGQTAEDLGDQTLVITRDP